ncbi:MAG: DcaP family trimeric outer membrane transporter, partial [Alphaproteobacteria bacterium]
SQIDSLQSRLDQLEKQKASVETTQAAAPADAVIGGDYPGSWKLPGSDTSMSIHGYTKADFIYDFNTNLGDTFNASAIPGSKTSGQHQGGNFHFGARQSRFNIETRTPTDWGQLKTFIEADFFGLTVNTNNTVGGGGNTSNPPRMRHAYGQLGPVLAGQTWSNFNDLDDTPELIDFNGGQQQAGGTRQTQVRYTLPVGNWTLSAALENPNPRTTAFPAFAVSGNAAVPVAAPVNDAITTDGYLNGGTGTGGNANDMPDITGHVEYKDVWGDVNLAGVVRHFNANNGFQTAVGAVNTAGGVNGMSSSAFAGGLILGGTWKWGQMAGGPFAMDSLAVTGAWGPGINRYFDTSGPANDAWVIPKNIFAGVGHGISIKPITQTGIQANIQHWWAPNVRTTLSYGRTWWDWGGIPFSQGTGAGAGTQVKQVQAAYVNLIWSPVKAVNIGLEFMYGDLAKRHPAGLPVDPGGNSGDAKRLMASLQYVF